MPYCDEYGQIDYEAMILARQEAQELAGDCAYYNEAGVIYIDTDSIKTEKTEGPYRGGFTHTNSVKEDPDGT